MYNTAAAKWIAFAAGVGSAYIYFYFQHVAKKPLLACSEGTLKQMLLEKCPSLTEIFTPTPWCWGGRLSTIITSLVKSAPMHIKFDSSETIPLADGGQIVIDWLHGTGADHARPTVLILPGINGNSAAAYVLHLVRQFNNLGYSVAVINHRGRGGVALLTPRSYCACKTDDLKAAVDHIKSRSPDTPLVAVGVSLGGLILFHYIVQYGRDQCGLMGGMTVSMAWDVFETSKELERPVNSLLLNWPVAQGLVKGIDKYLQLFEDQVDVNEVKMSRTIRQFDERFTAKVFGYPSLEAYYKDATACDKVHLVNIPLLCLNAADDPFSPGRSLPLNAASGSCHVALLVTKHGGHVAFNDHPLWPSGAGYIEKVAAEYVTALFQQHAVRSPPAV